MDAVRVLVRRDVRRHWPSLVFVTLLVGLVGTIVLTALAGARRTDSTFPRLLEQLDSASASVEVDTTYFDTIADLPQVEVVAPASFMFVLPEAFEGDALTMAAVDDRWNRLVDRPHLVDGRRAVVDRADEVFLNIVAADRFGVDAGDTLQLESFTEEQVEELVGGGDPGAPVGPRVTVTVVGIGRTEEDLSSKVPIVLFTPAFYARYRDDIGHYDRILQVRLERGADDLPAFEKAVGRAVPGEQGAIVETQTETSSQIKDATRVQAVSLVIFAVVAALAGFLAIAQVLSRRAARWDNEQSTLAALGLSRRQRFVGLLLPGMLAATAGAGLATAGTLLASPLMPTGFARQIEPEPGFAADWSVVGLGFLAVAVVVSGLAGFSAWAAAGRSEKAPPPLGSGSVVRRLVRLGAPPPAVTGVRMALEPGRAGGRFAVRAALAGAVVGVAGLIATFTFGAGLDWVVSAPEAYGLNWDTSVFGTSDPRDLPDLITALERNPDVGQVAALGVQPLRLEGRPVQAYGLEPSPDFVTVLDGDLPRDADEVTVGAKTLRRLGRKVGDTISAQGLEGGDRRRLTIVGTGVFPEFVHPAVPDSDTGSYNDFALLTVDGNAFFAREAGREFFGVALVRWAENVDGAAATSSLETEGAQTIDRPESFTNLARVQAFPALVAVFLVFVAAVAVGHVLVSSVQRRRRDLALLRTVGFTGSQVRATVAWQASTLAAVGLLLGIPAGLVIGRVAWSVAARGLGIDDAIPLPWLAIVLVVPAAFALVNIIAALPARRAARTPLAEALRSE